MDKILFKYLRYHSIDRYLREKGKATSGELTVVCKAINPETDYNEKDLKEDLEFMKSDKEDAYGAPVVFNEETKTWSYSDSSYSIQNQDLREEEKTALKWAVRYFDVLKNHQNLRGLRGIIQKLVDTMQIRENDSDLKSPDFVSSELPGSVGGSQFLAPLISAIRRKRVVRLYYLPFYEDKPYFTNIHPYLLKEYDGRWYLIGLNDTRKEIRTYGLDRIWELSETDQDYIQKKFSADDYFKNTIGVISPMGEPPEIHIEVSSHQAKYLISRPVHVSQYIEKEEDDYVIFSYRVHPTYEFKAKILAMGKDARVLKPESLRIEIVRELNNAILAYGRK